MMTQLSWTYIHQHADASHDHSIIHLTPNLLWWVWQVMFDMCLAIKGVVTRELQDKNNLYTCEQFITETLNTLAPMRA